MDRKIDVRNKYEVELLRIKNTLIDLENGKFYEKTGVRMDGRVATHVERLKTNINDLVNKIEYNKDSDSDKMREAVNKL